MRTLGISLAAALAGLAAPAAAGVPIQVDTTCPVGGESFTYITTPSYTTFGQRPDGKPYGSWTFPLALPECPSNALVVYRAFTPEEIAPLTLLVQSPDYQALKGETSYYRAAWLAERMGKSEPLTTAYILLSATWQADADPVMKARYQREFVRAAGAVAVDPAVLDTLFLRFRAANAYRELGDFPTALAMLDTLPLGALDVPVPEGDDVPFEQRNDAEARGYLLSLIAPMRKVIAAGDISSEPLDLMGDDYATSVCADLIKADPTAHLPERCNDPAIRKVAKAVVEGN